MFSAPALHNSHVPVPVGPRRFKRWPVGGAGIEVRCTKQPYLLRPSPAPICSTPHHTQSCPSPAPQHTQPCAADWCGGEARAGRSQGLQLHNRQGGGLGVAEGVPPPCVGVGAELLPSAAGIGDGERGHVGGDAGQPTPPGPPWGSKPSYANQYHGRPREGTRALSKSFLCCVFLSDPTVAMPTVGSRKQDRSADVDLRATPQRPGRRLAAGTPAQQRCGTLAA